MEYNWQPLCVGQRKSKLAALKKISSKKGTFVDVHVKHYAKMGISYNSLRSGMETKSSNKFAAVKVESSRKNSKRMLHKKYGKPSFTNKAGEARKFTSKQAHTTASPATIYNPRCVFLRPSQIPPISRLSSLVMKGPKCQPVEEIRHLKWSVGEMLWGKVRGFPFWPCMVSRDPFSKLFTRATGSSRTSRYFHVQFFGTEKERCWLNEASLLEFEGRDKFLDIVQYGLEDPGKHVKDPKEFTVSATWYPVWSLAVAEAEAAFKLDLAARIQRYTFQYMIVKGEDRRPVQDLMKRIWLKSGGFLRTKQHIYDNDGDDDANSDEDSVNRKNERSVYDSDDKNSSDESSSCEDKGENRPVKITVRKGLLKNFLTKHLSFVLKEHPDWQESWAVKHLTQQWSWMTEQQRRPYVTRNQRPEIVEVRQHRLQGSGGSLDAEENVDPDKLDLQIKKLSRQYNFVLSGEFCVVCGGQGSNLVCCNGTCGRHFHQTCMTDGGGDGSMCQECSTADIFLCFACKRSVPDTVQCSHMTCRKYYHDVCAREMKLTRVGTAGFICPLHSCATCAVEGSRPVGNEGSLIECVRCPVAYHSSDYCLGAGSQVIGQHQMVCASHFKPNKALSVHARVNMRYCLECGAGGCLLLCQGCPAAYHEGCGGDALDVPMKKMITSDNYRLLKADIEPSLCSQCLSGRNLLYGDIVWIKFGIYRWWPGEMCHPLHVPKRVQKKKHQVGEFPVRFFGSQDFAWVHQGRVILFERVRISCRDKLIRAPDRMFVQGVQESVAASKICASFGRVKQETESVRAGEEVKM